MSARTKIEWTDATWNPTRGCSRVSPGCRNCYAETFAARFSDEGQAYHGFARRGPARWTRKVAIIADQLELPLRMRKGRRIFVDSMSDLFHERLSFEEIAVVFGVMAACPQHTFQVLTKRAARLPEFFDWVEAELSNRFKLPAFIEHAACFVKKHGVGEDVADRLFAAANDAAGRDGWPLPNVGLGVSVESQHYAQERVPRLLLVPAAFRFASCEPLFGPVDLALGADEERRLDWVIAGGESSVAARPSHVSWIRSLRDQCASARVPFFFKQWGSWAPDAPPEAGAADFVNLDGSIGRMLFRDGNGVKVQEGEAKPGLEFIRGGEKWTHGALLDGREHREFPLAREQRVGGAA